MDAVFRGALHGVPFIAQHNATENYVFVGPASGIDLPEIDSASASADIAVEFAWDDELFAGTTPEWRHSVAMWVCSQLS